jgi:hypothetical protein
MTNAEKFKHLFGIYATELWAMPENDFLEWLNADAQDMPTEEQRIWQWIPCSERLPEESGLYIVTNVGRWVEPVGTRYYNIRADGGFWSGHPGDKVLAWMPLPEAYKEVTE